jgi:hypothetical protein
MIFLVDSNSCASKATQKKYITLEGSTMTVGQILATEVSNTPLRLIRAATVAGVLTATFFVITFHLWAEERVSDYIADIGASVESVEEDGSIILDGGDTRPYQHFVLWGLEVKDVEGLRSFLAGRLLECKVVHLRGPLPEADCLMHPEKDGRTVYRPLEHIGWRGPISAFDWLTDFGFAVQKCDTYSRDYYISDGEGQFWFCGQKREPDYGTFVFDDGGASFPNE